MSAHTPGPWDPTGYGSVVSRGTERYLYGGSIARGIQSQADVNLVAAAPELLEACKYILDWEPEGWSAEHARNLAKAAIAKAEGK